MEIITKNNLDRLIARYDNKNLERYSISQEKYFIQKEFSKELK